MSPADGLDNPLIIFKVVYQVNVEKKKPAEVARTFLENEGLLKEGDQ